MQCNVTVLHKEYVNVRWKDSKCKNCLVRTKKQHANFCLYASALINDTGLLPGCNEV